MAQWQLDEAKNKLSELIDRALSEGPQVITRHGVEVAVVISAAEYSRRTAAKPRLGDFFLNSPLRGSGIIIERDQTTQQRPLEL